MTYDYTELYENYKGKKFIHQEEMFEEAQKLDLETVLTYYNNDEYLNKQTQDLQDSTSPVTRRRFSPVSCDGNKSFGVHIDSDKGVYGFDERTNFRINISPSKTDFIDFNKSTVVRYDNGFGVPYQKSKNHPLNRGTQSYYNRKGRHGHINEYWYISYRRGSPYSKKNRKEDSFMPSTCRAQTFVPKISGFLNSLSLKLKCPKNPVSPLIIEIMEAHDKEGSKYNHVPFGRNYLKSDKGKPKVLARIRYQSKGTSPSLRVINFSNPPYVKQGKFYAIVLRSPFTRSKDPYWVGGWTKWCVQSKQKGAAYTSIDNGYHWKKHGKRETTSRNYGKWAPTNFYYICGIEPVKKEEPSTGDFYLYTKQMSVNPLKKVTLHPATEIDNKVGGNISYSIWDNGEWKDMKGTTYTFSEGKLPYKFALRVKFNKGIRLQHLEIELEMDRPEFAILRTKPYSPRLDGLLGASIYSKVHAPYEITNGIEGKDINVGVSIVREAPYNEFFEYIEAKDLFVNNDFETLVEEYENDETLKVQILSSIKGYRENYNKLDTTKLSDWVNSVHSVDWINSLAKEGIYLKEQNNFKISLRHGPAYPINYMSFQPFFDEDDANNERAEDAQDILQDLQEDIDILGAGLFLDESQIEKYKKQYYLHKVEEVFKVDVSSLKKGGRDFKDRLNDPSECLLTLRELMDTLIANEDQIFNQGEDKKGLDLSEFVDYNVDYRKGEITFTDNALKEIKKKKGGHFIIGYNPCFITNLTNDDFPYRVDLFTEEFTIKEIINPTFTLKAAALDPLRKVSINYNTNEQKDLIEDIDFKVDYLEHTISISSTANLKQGDKVTVKYTPYLVDESISLLYVLRRTMTENPPVVAIQPNYIEYKT